MRRTYRLRNDETATGAFLTQYKHKGLPCDDLMSAEEADERTRGILAGMLYPVVR